MRYPPLTDKKFEQLKKLMGRRHPLPSVFGSWALRFSFFVAGAVFGVLLQVGYNTCYENMKAVKLQYFSD